MTINTGSLPSAVSRVLPHDYRPSKPEWLVQDLVAEGEVTAFGASEAKQRLAIGVGIARGLLGATAGPVLGHEPVRSVRSALILATTLSLAKNYRLHTLGDRRVCVAQLTPWTPADPDYFESLEHWDEFNADIVLIDCVQDVPNGGPDASVLGSFERFGKTTVALFRGNDTRPGVGSTGMWAAAQQRFWFDPKTSQIHPVEAHVISAPWTVDLSLPSLAVRS